MGTTRKYFKNQFQVRKLTLNHDNASDFYISCWQRNHATVVPLLCVKAALFLGCLAILLASGIMIAMTVNFGFWFIYLTHWGVLLNTITTGFAFAVSLAAYRQGSIDTTLGLPWYVKTYWALYDISISLAFFITIYYWALLTDVSQGDPNPVLDVFIHAINSVLMLLLLICSRQPAYILHFYLPVAAGLVYIVFSVIYHFAGGTDPFGNDFIYPTLDWSEPGPTMVMVTISAVAIIVIHILVVVLTLIRNYLTRSFRREPSTLNIS